MKPEEMSCPGMCNYLDRLHRQRTHPNPNRAAGRTQKGGNPGAVLALVLFVLLGGGAAFYYFKFVKPKQNVKGTLQPQDFDFEDGRRGRSLKQIPGSFRK